MADRMTDTAVPSVVPLPDSLKECGCPNAKWGRHLTTCEPARAHDSIPLTERAEYAEGQRFAAVSWEYPMRMSAKVSIDVDLDPIAFILQHRKDYEAYQPDSAFAEYEKPMAYLASVLCEDGEDIMTSFDGNRRVSRASTMVDYDHEYPRWTREHYEALMEALAMHPVADPRQGQLILEGRRTYIPMPQTDGGSVFDLVTLDQFGKPSCREHGAMNKVTPSPPGFWRCLQGQCRAGCQEDTGGGADDD